MRGRAAAKARKLSDAQLGYIAGAIDGEGTISILRRKDFRGIDKGDHTWPHYHRPRVSIANTDSRMLDAIREWVGTGHTVWFSGEVYDLRFHAGTLRWLLPQLLPHLILKRRHAEIVLCFLNEHQYQGKRLTAEEWNGREDLCNEIRSLNKRTSSVARMAEVLLAA